MKTESDTRWRPDDLEALREILLEEDREAITYLARQIAELREHPVDPEVLKNNIRSVLADVLVEEIADSPDKAAPIWGPLVTAAIKYQVQHSPERVMSALQPIIGDLIRAHLVATVRGIFKRDRSESPPAMRGPTRTQAKQPYQEPPTSKIEPPTPPASRQREQEAYSKPREPRVKNREPQLTGNQKVSPLQKLNLRSPLLLYLIIVVLFGALLSIAVWWIYVSQTSPEPVDDLSQTVEEPAGIGSAQQEAPAASPGLPGDNQDVAAAQSEIDDILRETPLLFELNRSDIPPAGRVTLDRIAAILKKYPATQLEIQVYTDNVGSSTINRQISQSRAEAVKIYLSTYGRITPSRLIPIGRGPENPIASNSTPSGRRANRRAEFKVLPWQRDTR